MPEKPSTPAASNRKPLPRSREALTGLLRALENALGFLEPNLHGERMRLAELRKTLREPLRILQQRSFLKAVAEANERRFAQGGPSVSVLVPYVDAAKMERLFDRHKAARAKLVPPAGAEPGNVQAWRPATVALGDVVAAESGIIAHLRDLQQRVIDALDEKEQSDADKTDKNADKKSSSRVCLPRNLDVLRLAQEINRRGEGELSQIDIAIQFTEGDERRAHSLLRQLRRYRHLIRKPAR
jgi:hypothetical protein